MVFGINKVRWAETPCAATAIVAAELPLAVQAEEIDTEHIFFGFMIGSDVDTVGEREFQSETTGRFARGRFLRCFTGL